MSARLLPDWKARSGCAGMTLARMAAVLGGVGSARRPPMSRVDQTPCRSGVVACVVTWWCIEPLAVVLLSLALSALALSSAAMAMPSSSLFHAGVGDRDRRRSGAVADSSDTPAAAGG